MVRLKNSYKSLSIFSKLLEFLVRTTFDHCILAKKEHRTTSKNGYLLATKLKVGRYAAGYRIKNMNTCMLLELEWKVGLNKNNYRSVSCQCSSQQVNFLKEMRVQNVSVYKDIKYLTWMPAALYLTKYSVYKTYPHSFWILIKNRNLTNKT